jgi:hypothetical protein
VREGVCHHEVDLLVLGGLADDDATRAALCAGVAQMREQLLVAVV